MNVLEHLLKAIRSAATFNPEVQVAPACILWPDRDRQWEAVVPRLQEVLPELLVLGDYAPDRRTGPAIYLRCAIAGQTGDAALPKGVVPILYLPGISRRDLRVSEKFPPEALRPLVELQFRGAIWSQINGKDWTILAFLKSDQGGLGLDVAQDNDARHAMQLALYRLMDEDVERLKGKRLDRDYFNTLLTGGDPVRDLLHWLDQGDGFKNSRGEHEWHAFVEVCKSQLAFDPQREGVLSGAAKLSAREGPWSAVWERFCEAPVRYPNLPAQMRKCKPPAFDLFASAETAGGWPQWNEDREKSLHSDLMALSSAPPHEARKKLLELEKKHGPRRQLVWAELGEAPLAQALKFLAVLAEVAKDGLAAGGIADLVAGYQSQGWRADDAVLRALSVAEKAPDAVVAAIRAVYLPWVEESARHLQKVVDATGYPGGTVDTAKPVSYAGGECVVFVDGLRFDLARRLVEHLSVRGCQVQERPVWAALPSVTATGKAAVTPVFYHIRGEDVSADFEPYVTDTGQSLKGGYTLRKLLADDGWKVLDRADRGDGQGNAWYEFGDIDREGHDRGWKLARYLDDLLIEIRDRIEALFQAGWKSVRVVTDHGWLLMPGGLPKVDLPVALTDNKWGRCAAIKPGATIQERRYPWFWNPNHSFALADGISCFRKGAEYAHGGLSLQECLTLELVVMPDRGPAIAVVFTDIVWKGLRCTVAVEGPCAGLSLDIRTRPGDPASSVVVGVKPFKENGTASVVVEDEDLEGSQAALMVLHETGDPVAQVMTVIGEEVR